VRSCISPSKIIARRLQKRLGLLLTDGTAPDGLHLNLDWPRADDGGIQVLDAWLGEHPDGRLVVIDTLARFKPRATGRRTQYDEDRDAVDPWDLWRPSTQLVSSWFITFERPSPTTPLT
jgi:hypothetical protein